jgi:hypothetical protein
MELRAMRPFGAIRSFLPRVIGALVLSASIVLLSMSPSRSEDAAPAADSPEHLCDVLAASPFDRTKPAGIAGVETGSIDSKKAIPACRDALAKHPDDPRLAFQLARALYKDSSRAAIDEAVKLYRQAAEAGSALGMNNLGVMFDFGDGVGADKAEALKWFRKAADAGNLAAMRSLGDAYERGDGVAKDEAEAKRWYAKAQQ